jgi:hypothetical protein
MRFRPGFVCAVLLCSGGALAGELSTFEEAPARQAAAARGVELSEFPADVKAPERPLPWRAMGLGVLCFAAAAPFALRMYRSVCAETEERAGGGAR